MAFERIRKGFWEHLNLHTLGFFFAAVFTLCIGREQSDMGNRNGDE